MSLRRVVLVATVAAVAAAAPAPATAAFTAPVELASAGHGLGAAAATDAAGTTTVVITGSGAPKFSKPVVVDDEASTPPAVALAPDGTGIVAWSHDRRVYAVSIAGGRVGRAREVAASSGIDDLSVAAVVASTRAYVCELALAADETGRTTAAWPEDDYGNPTGYNRITSSIRTATAVPGHAFGTPRRVTPSGVRYRQSLSLTAASGRTALAWGYKRDSSHVGVQAAVGPAGSLGSPQTLASVALTGGFFMAAPTTRVALALSGVATVIAALPSEPAPSQIASRLVAVDGP
jgi:hypothetical protein